MTQNPIPQGLSVFVIEDEALVALNLESMLDDLGCKVVGPAMRFERAEQMLEEGISADVAIVDVNIGGRKIFELADKIAARDIPIVFATGYGRSGIPAEWQASPVLQKPYIDQDVRNALGAALAQAGQAGA
jgi:DNA-binding LytR/AlgR family response regulator